MASQLLLQWGPKVLSYLPLIIQTANGLYKAYQSTSASNEEKRHVDEAMKLIREHQGDIDKLKEDKEQLKILLKGLMLLTERLTQHYDSQGNHHFLSWNAMNPPCNCHQRCHWEPPPPHHCHDTRGPYGCHHPGEPTHPGCHHPEGPTHPGCHHPGGPTHPNCHHPGGPTHPGCHHPGGPTHPGCHHPGGPTHSGSQHQKPPRPSDSCSAQNLDDENYGAASLEPSSSESGWQTCDVCRNNYNTTDRRPTILACGHTFCRRCLGEVARQEPFLCPTCRTHENRPAALLPPNVVLMMALEEKGQVSGTENDDDEDDWKKTCILLQEEEELLMQMALQMSMSETEHNDDEDDWKKKSTLLQEEEELLTQMALQMSLKAEGGCDAQLYSDHEQEDSGSFQTVEKIKESCIKIEKHLKDDVLPKVASISSGLVEPQECMDELLRLKRVLMLADEHLMRHLEQLDTIVFEDTDFHGRLNKTLLLNRIQSVMDQFDTALVEINQLMQVYSS